MTYSVSYTTAIESQSVTNQDNLVVGGSVDSIVADYVSKINFKLAINQEMSISIPGLNAILSLMLVADNPVNISLTEDTNSSPLYDGVSCRQISKYYGSGGIVYDHIKVKAGTTASEVTLLIVGNETAPTS
jgi:hypothetical protein